MRRSWNYLIWAGFIVVLAAVFSYIPVFVPYPITRDVPWVNLLLFLLGGWLLAFGIKRAYGEPQRYRGRIAGAVLGVLSSALLGLFCWGILVSGRQIPSASGSPRVGDPAPDFTLPDAGGRPVTLSELRKGSQAVLLIFYRGYW